MSFRPLFLALMLGASTCAFAQAPTSTITEIDPGNPGDPYLYLEDIEGDRAIADVTRWNAETDALLLSSPGFENDRARAQSILDDDRQIAMPDAVLGNTVTNLWRDATNPRGLWRSSPLDAYLAGKPEWTTILDVDALGRDEGTSWVWHGANCLAPAYTRCLVSVSDGGTDADVVREFDLVTRQFVEGGFVVPQAKSNVAWLDADTLLVATDYGDGSLTESGYPRIVKLWKRGTPLADAQVVAEGAVADIGMTPFLLNDEGTNWSMIGRGTSFYNTLYLVRNADGAYVETPIPDTADVRDVIDGQAIVFLNAPLGDFAAGSLIAYPLVDLALGVAAAPVLVMAPTASQAIEEVSATDDVLWVKALDDVQGKLFALTRDAATGAWSQREVPLAANATVHIAGSIGETDRIFATAETMLTPPTLYALSADGARTEVASLPATFDASGMTVEQRFATSKDGTRVPYFLVRRAGTTGPVPALIHAYGGFRAAQTPTYLTGQPYRAGPLGLFWVEDGNAYVLANIRGGGEYGPGWHEAALRERRQNSFDDLHAVALDLVGQGISQPGSIAISGRSNGGVLVGAAMTQEPDLYGAVISGSPLHDMYRYDKLLAGASWVAEYGDPDVPEDWAFMKLYSPYQNVRPNVEYPPTFFYLSTKDDRVHPGHARKMAAKLAGYGNTVYFHEYREGGHSVGADHAEDAVRTAMLMAFLQRELKGEGVANAAPAGAGD